MKVIYSIATRFAGGGIGNIARHQAQALDARQMLELLLCGSAGSSAIPASQIRSLGLPSRALLWAAAHLGSRGLRHTHSVLYDRWSTRLLRPADLFFFWNGDGLHAMARAQDLGMVTVTCRASTHPLYQQALLREEYGRWGLSLELPAASIDRCLREVEEADYILVPSTFVLDSFLAYNAAGSRAAGSRAVQVPFAVDVSRFCPAPKPEGSPFRVLFVGQVGLRKGMPYLIEAWQRLGWSDAELLVLGQVQEDVSRWLPTWRQIPGVRFLGHSDDPVRVYQSADVFAFPSIEEGSAMVTYEAMACGLPVVTTPNAGSYARDGQDGFIVPIRDVDALAQKLQRLRDDEALRQTMGHNARLRALDFAPDRVGDEFVSRLQALCTSR